MSRLKELLIQLDMALTCRNRQECEHTASNQSFDVFDLISNSYYLSDGGYSRICFSFDDDSDDAGIFLSSVSREEVATRWRYVSQMLIDDINTAATAGILD